MQTGFMTKDSRVMTLFADMPGARSMVLAALDGQGGVMTDSPVHPTCALAWAGDFLYCGGRCGPAAVRLLRRALGRSRDWLIYAPGDWMAALESISPVNVVERIAYDHRHQPEDAHLRRILAAMPEDIRLQPIEGEWITRCRQAEWSRDFVSLFTDEDFARRGLGVLLVQHGEPVCGASSYVSYPGGVEVQLQTRDDRQGRGYATLAAAALILMAHERGLIATWDAANPASDRIARKLGYRPLGTYRVAMLAGNGNVS